MAAGDVCVQAGNRRRLYSGDARGRRRTADSQAQKPGDRHHRSAAQRAALCVATQHHEGQEETDRRKGARRCGRGRQSAARSAQDGRPAWAEVRRQGRLGRRTRGQTQERGRHPMTTLLIAEHDNKSLKDATAKALTAATALGADVHVLVAGKDCEAVAQAAAKLKGVAKVLVADAPTYEHMLAEPVAALIVSVAPQYEAIVSPATTTGKNFMPRVAALLDV